MSRRSARPQEVSLRTDRRAPSRPRVAHGLTALVGLALAVVLIGCGGSDSDDAGTDASEDVTTTTADDTTTAEDDAADDGATGDSEPAGPTAELPDDFPEELTPPDDAVYRTALANEQGGKKDWLVAVSIPGDVTEVADAIVAQMEAADYTISVDEAGGIPGGAQSRTIQAESDTYVVSLSVDDADVVGGVEGSANASYTVTEK